ncbi:iron chelate uptake ABC transporter family permease subunit, partial [Staphylococcus hominis]|uniref:iron chelate uptake ABC transporter family permease subunit n=1 Tax=Staphylococcus hominis TaxID=1290 RepID=UPI000A7DE3E0
MTHHSLAIRYALVVTILIISIFISLCVGATKYNPVKVINSLLIQDDFILNEYRIPRTLLGLIVGSSLAISGTIIQGVVKNPLAYPDVIGMTKGASLAAIIIIMVFPNA